jgi:carboxyl-terminal processing protease
LPAVAVAKDFEEFRISAFGDYGGIGAQIAVQEGFVTVVAALPHTPAERAGLRPGDRIVTIDGCATAGWTSEQAVGALRGPKASPVSLSITHLGSPEPVEYRIVRDEIRLQSVPYAFMLDESTGYARLTAFNETTTQELQAALADLRSQGMSRFVLDLRGNPGGLLDQGAAVTDLFLPQGQAIVETRYRDPRENETYRATAGVIGAGELPMIVLIDEYSASAAEIVAGALQDHDRALVLGAPSFGKGSTQQLFRLTGGNFLKITTGLWYTPSGRSIQKTASAGTKRSEASRSAAADTATIYRSDTGRTMRGGGGIAPDRLAAPDTITLAERAFLTQAAKGGGVFNEVLFRFAVEFGLAQEPLAPDLARG